MGLSEGIGLELGTSTVVVIGVEGATKRKPTDASLDCAGKALMEKAEAFVSAS